MVKNNKLLTVYDRGNSPEIKRCPNPADWWG